MDDSQITKKELLDEVASLREAIEELEESKVRYQRLSETVLEAIAMHDEGVIVECNDAFAKIFEYDNAELVGKNIFELIAEDCRDLVRKKVASGVTEPYT
ncbi:MAG: PAS domain S-box protein, partial [bacterium]